MGKAGISRENTDHFGGSENTLYDSKVIGACHCKFVQTHRIIKCVKSLGQICDWPSVIFITA